MLADQPMAQCELRTAFNTPHNHPRTAASAAAGDQLPIVLCPQADWSMGPAARAMRRPDCGKAGLGFNFGWRQWVTEYPTVRMMPHNSEPES